LPQGIGPGLCYIVLHPEDLIGETGLRKQLTKQLLERSMQAEMTEHLGYEKNAPAKKKTNNFRNGSYGKRVGVRQYRYCRPP